MNNWLRRYWPNLVMVGSIPAGYLLGLLVLYTATKPTNEIVANLIVGISMFAAVTLTFTALVATGQGAAPPHIVVWVLGLALAATLLVIF